MPNTNTSNNSEAVMSADQLVIALHEMRDELLKTSRMVKDYSVYLKSVSGGEAVENVNKLLRKI